MLTTRPHTSRLLAWLPLAALLVVIAASLVTGRAPSIGSANAASSIPVEGEITSDLYLDATGCSAASVAIGELVVADPWKTAQDTSGGATCSLDFGTSNHMAGTTLTMLEDPAAPVAPAAAMKCITPDCLGSSISDFDGPAEPAAGSSAFGAQLLSVGGVATGTWSAAPAVHDVQNAGDTTCETSATGTGTCAFTFGATASAASAPGSYQAQARLVVLAK
ncbi:MAG: hypothetical protein JWM90_2449 [Thermoleophilia bacterium]|nr:hypothetical protein [Thermoleophilia bacterium]